jgi:hypothetical protein
MRARLIVIATMVVVIAGLFAIAHRSESRAAGHQAGIICQDGSVLVGAITYVQGGSYSIDGAGWIHFQNGFGPLTLSGNVRHHLVVTAPDWPTFDDYAGPCIVPTTVPQTTTPRSVPTTVADTTTVPSSTSTVPQTSTTTVPGTVPQTTTGTVPSTTISGTTIPGTVPQTSTTRVEVQTTASPNIPALPVTE